MSGISLITGKNMQRKFFRYFIIILGLLLIISVLSSYSNLTPVSDIQDNENQNSNHIITKQPPGVPKGASSEPNGKPLLVHQYANISKSFVGDTFPKNVSYNLAPDWTSKNVTINYEGVSKKKDWVINGELDSSMSGWTYKSDGEGWYGDGYISGSGNPMGSVEFYLNKIALGDYAYFEQNISIPEEFASVNAFLSVDYYMAFASPFIFNGSVFISLIINNIEINNTADILSSLNGKWIPLSLIYNPLAYGQVVPNNATLRVGVYGLETYDFPSYNIFRFDNIKCELWTKPNISNIVIANDIEFNQNYTYSNTDYGEGFSFIDEDRYRSESDTIVFTIYQNLIDVMDFKIDSIIINSPAEKLITSEVSGRSGSKYITGSNITWYSSFSISSIPQDYNSWAEIKKPSDWVFTKISDPYEAEHECAGNNYGSTKVLISNTILKPGLWNLEAISKNYISKGYIGIWNSTDFCNDTTLTFNDLFQISITLNETLSLFNTQINCTIFYPNSSIFWQNSREPTSYIEKYGNFTVGKNMTVGKYLVIVEWVNNISSNKIDQVGYIELELYLWHHTNLTAVDTYIEKLAGDPCLIKVNYTDYDLDTYIAFATVTYISTSGQSGSMIYIGSGTYFIDLDTSSLELGDYYFSFNASKIYYENQSKNNLVHLKIIAQPLAIEVPSSALNAMGNSYVICKINVTGALSSAPIWPANVSTDWSLWYNVTDNDDGSYTLNFSTSGIPTQGYLQSYTINLYANKTNYGTTSNFITLIVHPIPTSISVNQSIYMVYLNEIFYVKINYSHKDTGAIISGAIWDVTWASLYDVFPLAEGYIIRFNTIGFSIDTHTALVEMKKPGYETEFISVTAIIGTQDVNLTVNLNNAKISENTLIDLYFKENINISARVFALVEKKFLSGGIVTWISENYENILIESPSTYFNSSIIIDGAYFNPGLNYIYLQFQQTNYTTKTFSFQLFIRTQSINLTLYIDKQQVQENYLAEKKFNERITLSCRAYAQGEKSYLSNCSIVFINGDYEHNLTGYVNNWYNDSIVISTSYFDLGLNYVYIKFIKTNYTTTTFSFQILVQQINIDLETIDFDDSIEAYVGESIKIQIKLFEEFSNIPIEGAEITYEWEFGVGEFDEEGKGIYEVEIDIPENIELKNYKLELIISKSGGLYKSSEHEIIIDVNQRETPDYWLWILIAVLLGSIGLLTSLSLRAYVFLPRQRKKERELLSKTQNFKDMRSIQALVLIHRLSGLPIYHQTFGFLEDADTHLFSGFVQAITTIGQELAQKDAGAKFSTKQRKFAEHMMEIDFKYFYALIYDHKELRIVFILSEKSSENLREKIRELSEKITLELKDLLEVFQGDLTPFKKILPPVINQSIDLYLKAPFKLAHDLKIAKAHHLTTMETRVINVLRSYSKNGENFLLNSILKMTNEKNEDLIIEAIESLIKKKLIIPSDKKSRITKGKMVK